MVPTIELVDEPGPEIGAVIGAPLRRFNRQQTGSSEIARLLALTILAPGSSEIIGGLWGESGWGHLHIDLLVVPEEMRGTGVGRTLMQRAEEEALRRGCHSVWLDTFSFQARGFYEKLGYTVFGALDDYPVGHTRFFLRKTIAPAVPSAA